MSACKYLVYLSQTHTQCRSCNILHPHFTFLHLPHSTCHRRCYYAQLWEFFFAHEYFVAVLYLSAKMQSSGRKLLMRHVCGIMVWIFGGKWGFLRCSIYIYTYLLYLLQHRLNDFWCIAVSFCMCVCECMCFNLHLFCIIHYNDGSVHCIQSMHSYTLVCIYAPLSVHDLAHSLTPLSAACTSNTLPHQTGELCMLQQLNCNALCSICHIILYGCNLNIEAR